MGYMDDQTQKDTREDERSLKYKHHKTAGELVGGDSSEETGKVISEKKPAENKIDFMQGNTEKKGLFSRLRDALTGGASDAKNRAKKGVNAWKAGKSASDAASSAASGAASVAKKAVAKFANPKSAAIIAALGGTGFLSFFGIFTIYKNDDVMKNDPPIRCEEGTFELPQQGDSGDNDIQKNVDIMYDIFVNQLGYSDNFLIGLLSCMGAESEINPDRLESDYILTGAKAAFDGTAGPGMAVGTSTTQSAFDAYASAFRSGGGWNGNPAYFADGKMTCGIGLVQWTGGRAIKLIEGLDIVGAEYSVMDLPYQCAFLLAEFKTNYKDLAPDGSWSSQCSSSATATEYIFTTFVSGGKTTGLEDRIAWNSDVEGYVHSAAANSEFTSDIVSMAEILAGDSFSAGVASAQDVQLCVNGTMIRTSSIAMAAASISWIERGDYEDEHGAYGEYKRSSRTPNIVNDWDYIEGKNGADGGTKESHQDGDYEDDTNLPYYTKDNCGGGKHDLIACTEYYYFAHLIAFPTETGEGKAGYFSSCDRGTATAVRIAGADDMFPAGNPKVQLAYALGAVSKEDRHDEHNAEKQDLWEPTGFLRGCDYYSFGGGTTIPAGNIMISWSNQAANGMITEGSGEVDGDGETEFEDMEDGEMVLANLRFPLANTNTTRHIMTFIGEGTVETYWGNEWLFQQYNLFDDADSLIRGDLTIDAPKVMKDGAAYKSKTASKSGDQKTTFYIEQNKHAKDNEDVKEDEISERQIEFNAKTGLPEFKAWEQIFVRLIHNSDDDASRGKNSVESEKDMWIKYERDKDNYLDDADVEDHIEQYGKDGKKGTHSNKYFYEDWNSVGAGEVTDGGDGDYEEVAGNELLWWDDGSDEWTQTWTRPMGSGVVNNLWRYEYVTDVEYRLNQLMRFGMASMMCSYASEEDASVYQNGGDEAANETGHILGNVYRRMSRISDDIDKSGRYYYYNTVVSNDMLQDLTQLYSFEGNGEDEETHVDDNFGPVYDIIEWYSSIQARGKNSVKDRRYGLTAADIDEIMGGFAGFSMGASDGFNEKLNEYIYTPMYQLDEEHHLALYDMDTDADSTTDDRGAHETSHTPNDVGSVYKQEIYGLNPFLVFDKYLERDLNDLNDPNLVDEGGYRSDEVTGDKTDDRLAFIDRHYYADDMGNINMFAFSVLGMNPSRGKEIQPYTINQLRNIKTIEATETSGTGPNTGVTDADNLAGSWGKVRYTDYIYGEDETANKRMAKRLYGDDDRDNNNKRDDYNRREWSVIPYYHTHAQECKHHDEIAYNYDLICKWWNDQWDYPEPDAHKIDSQTYQNNQCRDALDTISFDSSMDLRSKYEGLNEMPLAYGSQYYYIMDGSNAIDITEEKPPMHVTCPGYTCAPGTDDDGNPLTETCLFCERSVTYPDTCYHSCDELAAAMKHDIVEHLECMEGCECHDHYGCNAAEYYFHNGTMVYMVIQVSPQPKEMWNVDIDITDFMFGGTIVCDKGNLLQQIEFDSNGVIKNTYEEALQSMADPNYSLDPFTSPRMSGESPKVYTNQTEHPAYNNGDLIGYFTIEGDVISDDEGKLGETIEDGNACVGTDLHRVESIRNRVADGKPGQTFTFKTGVEKIPYSNTNYDGYGSAVYGEIKVTGAQHGGHAMPSAGNYGDPEHGGSGPDTAMGNKKLAFGNSLLREILGDEHVFHIRFGSQDEETVTGGNNDVYDFKFYEEFGDFDNDAVYKDRYTHELTDEYFSYLATDEEKEADEDVSDPMHANIPLPAESRFGLGTEGKHTAGPVPGTRQVAVKEDEVIHGQDEGQNGDYGLWITHASRGTRGMKTQYLIFKNFFGDVYKDDTYTNKTAQYMIFGNVTKQDEKDVDGDGFDEEAYIYGMGGKGGKFPKEATNKDNGTVYGQGGNSHWKMMIDIYNEGMSNTRHFD